MRNLFLVSLILMAGLSSCYYDNFAELNPGIGLQGCNDTAGTIGFAANILPIMNANCGTNNPACHQNNSSPGFFELGTQAGVEMAIAEEDNKFIKSIRHEAGAIPMPKNAPGKIDACSIAVIEKWLATGRAN